MEAPEKDMHSPSASPMRGKGTRVLLWGVGTVLFILAVGLALWLHPRIVNVMDKGEFSAPVTEAAEASAALSLDGLLPVPAGMELCQGDPTGLEPLPKARQILGFRWKSADTVQKQAVYRWAGSPGQAEAFYRRQFDRSGKTVSPLTRTSDGWVMTAVGEQETAVIQLQSGSAQEDPEMRVSVSVFVPLASPAPSTRAREENHG
jgi:hypothetical protein